MFSDVEKIKTDRNNEIGVENWRAFRAGLVIVMMPLLALKAFSIVKARRPTQGLVSSYSISSQYPNIIQTQIFLILSFLLFYLI